jgi:polyisoprenoid-binding protein YceI
MKILFITALFLPLLASAQTAWKSRTAAVTFSIKNAGFRVEGSFGGFVGNLLFDPQNLPQSHIEATVQSKTIDTGNKTRDDHLRKEEYFDVEKFPVISLKSTKIAAAGKNLYKGTFQLTLKGITKTVEIPFTLTESKGNGQFEGTFKINRQDFKVGGGSWILSDEVTLHLSLQATVS